KAAVRTKEVLWTPIGELLDAFPPRSVGTTSETADMSPPKSTLAEQDISEKSAGFTKLCRRGGAAKPRPQVAVDHAHGGGKNDGIPRIGEALGVGNTVVCEAVDFRVMDMRRRQI